MSDPCAVPRRHTSGFAFVYTSTEVDDALYPHLVAVASGPAETYVVRRLERAAEVTAYELDRSGQSLVLVWAPRRASARPSASPIARARAVATMVVAGAAVRAPARASATWVAVARFQTCAVRDGARIRTTCAWLARAAPLLRLAPLSAARLAKVALWTSAALHSGSAATSAAETAICASGERPARNRRVDRPQSTIPRPSTRARWEAGVVRTRSAATRSRKSSRAARSSLSCRLRRRTRFSMSSTTG